MAVGPHRAEFKTGTVREFRHATIIAREVEVLSRVVQEIRNGDVVYDIGAFIGTHAVIFALATGPRGRVVAFEPEWRAARNLHANVLLNGLHNVTVIEQAVTDATGEAELHMDDSRVLSGFHSLMVSRGGHGEMVPTVAGDELVAKGDLPAPNVIKIDVEGAELKVIAGLSMALSRPECRLVLCEVHPDLLAASGDAPSDVQDALAAAGFSTFERFGRGSEYHLLARK